MSTIELIMRRLPFGLLILLIASVLSPSRAEAQQLEVQEVVAADDAAIGAAISSSQATFESAETVIVARNDVFADSLSSGSVQGRSSPLLLVEPTRLPFSVVVEIRRLGATRAVILGSGAAVSMAVESQLLEIVDSVERIGGATRIETAVNIAARFFSGTEDVILARAFPAEEGSATQAFADALGAGALAADRGVPLLLTQTEVLTGSTRTWLEDSQTRSVTIVGGTAAVGSAVEAELDRMGISIVRLAGKERTTTAREISIARGLGDAQHVLLLEAGQRLDSWAAGFGMAAFAARNRASVMLTFQGQPLALAQREIRDHAQRVTCAPLLRRDACESTAGEAETPVVTIDVVAFAPPCVSYRHTVTSNFVTAETIPDLADQFGAPCTDTSTTIYSHGVAGDQLGCAPGAPEFEAVAYTERSDGPSLVVFHNYDQGVAYCAEHRAFSERDGDRFEFIHAEVIETR